MNPQYEAMVRKSQPRGSLPPERVQAKVAAFTEWMNELPSEQKQSLKEANNVFCAYIKDMGPISAYELLAEIFLLEQRKRHANH